MDAILCLRGITEAANSDGNYAIAVSIDISNAFNSLLWPDIHDALRDKGVPVYLRNIMYSYLCDRSLVYVNSGGMVQRRRISCGVPQGSVLGPLLWNLTYDQVLRGELPRGCHAIGYADNTLIVATGRSVRETAVLAERAVAGVLDRIGRLGLRVAAGKTVACIFPGRRGFRPLPVLTVGDSRIPVGLEMRYLGLTIDRRWSFRSHFSAMLPKVEFMATSLARLMPNSRGPGEQRRRLHASVVNSVLLYGAPVWAEKLAASRFSQRVSERIQRRLSLRIICAYRTVSGVAAGILARQIPLDLLAIRYRSVFVRIRESEREGNIVTLRARRIFGAQAVRDALDSWAERISRPNLPGERTRLAVGPKLVEWMERSHGRLTFRSTQFLTGHGCFAAYLYKINRAYDPVCVLCYDGEDTAEHTLGRCVRFSLEREALVDAIGVELALPKVVERILENRQKWQAFSRFCESVMLVKEEDERRRQTLLGPVIRVTRAFVGPGSASE